MFYLLHKLYGTYKYQPVFDHEKTTLNTLLHVFGFCELRQCIQVSCLKLLKACLHTTINRAEFLS